MELDSVMMLIRFLFLFSLLFILLPLTVIRLAEEDRTLLDRIFIPLIHSTTFVVIVVHLLVVIKLFETLSFIVVCIIALVIARRIQNRYSRIDKGTKLLTEFFDFTESGADFIRKFKEWLKQSTKRSVAWVWHAISVPLKRPIASILIAATLGYAVYTRFWHSLVHYYFASSDPYVHMKFAKYVQKNILYVDGLYPYGYDVILAALSRFFLIDMYVIVRYIGPLTGLLIVLSIGYAVLKIRNNPYAAFAAMFAYSVCSLLPVYLWRQLSALSMEYAVVFFMPGVVFWLLYCRGGQLRYLLLTAECLFLSVSIHPYAGAAHAVAIVVIGLVYLVSLYKAKRLWRAAVYFIAAGLTGVAPIAIGYISGVSFTGTVFAEYVMDTFETETGSEKPLLTVLFGWMTEQDWIIAGVLLAVTALLCSLYWLQRRRHRLDEQPAYAWLFLAIFAVYLALYRSVPLGLPIVVPVDRLSVFFAVVGAVTVGIAAAAVGRIFEGRSKRFYVSGLMSIALAAGVLYTGQVVARPIGDQYQYDEAVQAYLKIKEEFDFADWTIVSTIEEYPLVEGYGYHTNIWEFVQQSEPGEAGFTGFTTNNIFFFVEFEPFYSTARIEPSDALKPFPGPVIGDPTEFYYRSENRKTIEAKLFNWLLWYKRNQPDKLTVYFESPEIAVYRLQQAAKPEPIPLPPLPAEEQGVWE